MDREPDRIASYRMEMHEELTRAWVVPQAAMAHTKEGARGLAVASAIGMALGVVLAFPLAAIHVGSTNYAERLIVWLIVGVAFGGTIGLIAGPGIASVRPDAQMAATGGSLLRVRRDTPEVRAILDEAEPVRIDELDADDQPIETLKSEGPGGVVDTAQDMVKNAAGDDYHEPPRRPER